MNRNTIRTLFREAGRQKLGFRSVLLSLFRRHRNEVESASGVKQVFAYAATIQPILPTSQYKMLISICLYRLH